MCSASSVLAVRFGTKYRLPDGRQVQKKSGRRGAGEDGRPPAISRARLPRIGYTPCRMRRGGTERCIAWPGVARHLRTPRPSGCDLPSRTLSASRRRSVTIGRCSSHGCCRRSGRCRSRASRAQARGGGVPRSPGLSNQSKTKLLVVLVRAAGSEQDGVLFVSPTESPEPPAVVARDVQPHRDARPLIRARRPRWDRRGVSTFVAGFAD